MTPLNARSTGRSKVFEDILYAQCWEDPELDRQAFATGPDDVIFSITSGGCNVLSFLLDDPRTVIALDVNPHQNHLLELKMAAFRALPYQEVVEFLGVVPSVRRVPIYRRLRPYLEPESRAFWDGQKAKIHCGIIHCGRYEAYLKLIRTWIYRLKGRSLVDRIFFAGSPAERVRIYRQEWDTRVWRILTRLLLSRITMTMLFDKAFFAQLEQSFSFGDHFRSRVERVLTGPSVRDNPFLSYILLGRYCGRDALPLYLQPQHFDLIRNRLHRIRIVNDSCERYFAGSAPNTISRFNFTNIFEWMDRQAFERVLRETVRIARDGSVMTYRNLLVPRSRPESMAGTIIPDRRLSAALHRLDRSFIYRAFVVERISKPLHHLGESQASYRDYDTIHVHSAAVLTASSRTE